MQDGTGVLGRYEVQPDIVSVKTNLFNWAMVSCSFFLTTHLFAQTPLPDQLNPGTSSMTGVPIVYGAGQFADGRICVVGDFQFVGGVSRSGVAILDQSGIVDLGFNASVINHVAAFCLQLDGKLLLGGDFRKVGGQNRMNLARLNADGTLDLGFIADLDSGSFGLRPFITCIALQQDGKILIGGSFKSVNFQFMAMLARSW